MNVNEIQREKKNQSPEDEDPFIKHRFSDEDECFVFPNLFALPSW